MRKAKEGFVVNGRRQPTINDNLHEKSIRDTGCGAASVVVSVVVFETGALKKTTIRPGRPVGGGHVDDLADHQHGGDRCHANADPQHHVGRLTGDKTKLS